MTLEEQHTVPQQFMRVTPSDIEIPRTSKPDHAASVIMTNTFGIARRVLDADAKQRSWKFATEQLANADDPPVNLILHLSQQTGETADARIFTTDIALLRTILNPRVVAIASAYFEKVAGVRDFVLPYHALNCRYYDADPEGSRPDSLLPFHQDAIGFPPYYKVLNFWTLLYPEECGTTSPGLDFGAVAPSSFIERERQPTSKNFHFLETRHRFVEDLLRETPPITPSVQQGDLLIFNELALHRTSTRPGPTKSRASAEVRFVAATEQVLAEFASVNLSYAHVYGDRRLRIRWASEWTQSKEGDPRFVLPTLNHPIKQTDLPLWTPFAALRAFVRDRFV